MGASRRTEQGSNWSILKQDKGSLWCGLWHYYRGCMLIHQNAGTQPSARHKSFPLLLHHELVHLPGFSLNRLSGTVRVVNAERKPPLNAYLEIRVAGSCCLRHANVFAIWFQRGAQLPGTVTDLFVNAIRFEPWWMLLLYAGHTQLLDTGQDQGQRNATSHSL